MNAPLPTTAYEVVLWEFGNKWSSSWDGEIHATRELGEAALAEAREAGWDAHLAELRITEATG